MGKLEGRVARATGGGSGVGRSTAKMMAAEGAQVVIAGRTKLKLDVVDDEIDAGRAAGAPLGAVL